MQELMARSAARRTLFAIFVVVLGAGVWLVLSPFLVSMAWAAILAYSSWPIYRKLLVAFGGRSNMVALIMTLAMSLAVILPMLWLFIALKNELMIASSAIASKLNSGSLSLPRFVTDLPLVGADVTHWFTQIVANPAQIKAEAHTLLSHTDQLLIDVIGGITRNLTKMGFAMLTLFFAYRGGESFMLQTERILQSMLGLRVRGYFQSMGDATRGVIYGIVLTALAQGLVAGLGYWLVGLDTPLMLTAITVMFAMIPFATPLVWASLGIWLLLTGNTAAGAGLLLWGMLVVSWVDNVIRPIVLAKNVKIPFILAFFGVLGGLSAFGFIGLFLGPVILAVAFAVWQEWLEAHPEKMSHD